MTGQTNPLNKFNSNTKYSLTFNVQFKIHMMWNIIYSTGVCMFISEKMNRNKKRHK